MKTLLFFSQGYGEFRYGTSIQKSPLKKMRFFFKKHQWYRTSTIRTQQHTSRSKLTIGFHDLILRFQINDFLSKKIIEIS